MQSMKVQRINVVVGKAQWAWLRREARAQGLSASALLRRILDRVRES